MTHVSAIVATAECAKRAPDLTSYDRIIVAFSGGKDSIACLVTLMEAGVPASRIDVYHPRR